MIARFVHVHVNHLPADRFPEVTGDPMMRTDMPRFFFDAQNGVDARDDVGRELPDTAAAQRVAVTVAAFYASDPDRLIDEGVIVVRVRDEAGAVVATVRLACLVEAA
ncbi:hypothetical protein EKPJFOCH_2471 [Methylobacterium thuringiense]|uniref:DUF6894 domain-containing protein n=2 Tax=Methylobacterium thuringiense TaxID=1003091 RepID=A0ABQ4TM80_9HYPH|nr:hypothetical protein EKPJFOCH_2471 [Methylobacterium thuringiense]